jgi:hypothetical protein
MLRKEGEIMMTMLEMGNVSSDGCDCCRLSSEELPEKYGCTDRKDIFTPREQEVLKRIREAADTAKSLKQQLHPAEGAVLSSEARKSIEEDLENLRRVRVRLEEERTAAAEERMRYLGHV